jgi:hypothetical protein
MTPAQRKEAERAIAESKRLDRRALSLQRKLDALAEDPKVRRYHMLLQKQRAAYEDGDSARRVLATIVLVAGLP